MICNRSLLVRFIPVTVGFVLAVTPAAAFASDGQLDTTFGSGGKVTTDFASSFDNASAVAIQSDGKIVAAGGVFGSAAAGSADFALARYNSDGSLDTTFGIGGKVQTDFASSYERAYALTIQADGKIVAAGISQIGGDGDFALVRYNSDGSLDTSFGSGGIVHTDFGATFFEQANAVAVQSDGKIIAAGQTFSFSTGTDLALARYNSDGSLDTSFGSAGTGKVTLDVGGGAYQQINAIAIQSDGMIVAAGYTAPIGGSTAFLITRYTTGGSLDSTFGTGGIVLTTLFGTNDLAHSLVIQPDGRIIVGGETTSVTASSANTDFALVRYNTDGSLDASFGASGIVTTDFTSGSTDQVRGVALQVDGKIVAAGRYFVPNVPGNGDFAVARYNTDGSLDTTFGNGGTGFVTTDFSVSSDDCSGVALQSDGQIVVVGSTTFGSAIGAADFALARYDVTPVP